MLLKLWKRHVIHFAYTKREAINSELKKSESNESKTNWRSNRSSQQDVTRAGDLIGGESRLWYAIPNNVAHGPKIVIYQRETNREFCDRSDESYVPQYWGKSGNVSSWKRQCSHASDTDRESHTGHSIHNGCYRSDRKPEKRVLRVSVW